MKICRIGFRHEDQRRRRADIELCLSQRLVVGNAHGFCAAGRPHAHGGAMVADRPRRRGAAVLGASRTRQRPLYAYPSLAVNSRNDVVVGYSSFPPTSSAITGAVNYDIPGTLRSGAVLKAGLASYVAVDQTGSDRWGISAARSMIRTVIQALDVAGIRRQPRQHLGQRGGAGGPSRRA